MKATFRVDGGKVRAKREAQSKGRAQFAEEADISIDTLEAIEKGERPDGRPTTIHSKNLHSLAKVLDTPADDLLIREETQAPFDTKLPEQLQDCLFPIDTFIENRTAEFVGRDFVFDEIKSFLAGSPGYFIIEGDAGMGKSAILAEYGKRSRCIAHFNIRTRSFTSAAQFLRSVCAQLMIRYALGESLPPDADKGGRAFGILLKAAADAHEGGGKKGPLVIAIDALDEVDSATQDPGANVLYLPESLPKGVFIIATARRRSKLRLLVQERVAVLNLKAAKYDAKNATDVGAYIRKFTAHKKLKRWIGEQQLTAEQFVTELAKKSQNNFMYLRYVLPAIEDGEYQTIGLENLPAGLESYYEDHWSRMGMTAKPLPRHKLDIIYQLSAARRPISVASIAEVLKMDEVTVQEVLDEWDQFLHTHQEHKTAYYSIYHESFSEFLYSKPIVEKAGKRATSVHAGQQERKSTEGEDRRFADHYWDKVMGDE